MEQIECLYTYYMEFIFFSKKNIKPHEKVEIPQERQLVVGVTYK